MKIIYIWIQKILLLIDHFSQLIFGPMLKKFPRWLTPNMLSGSRIIMLVIIIYCYLGLKNIFLYNLFVLIAGITDYLDGLLARVTGQVTELGKILDRSIDKIFTIPILVLFINFESIFSYITLVYILVDTISLILTFSASLYNKPLTSSNAIGKIKFIFIFTAIMFYPYNSYLVEMIFILPATIMAIWSLLNHLKRESNTAV